MDKICVFCKGRLWCGRKYCPIQAKISAKSEIKEFKEEYTGVSPNIFVGRANYPKVRVGILSTETYENNDEPKLWNNSRYSISRVIKLRTGLINSVMKDYNINSSKFQEVQEIAMAQKPADLDIKLEKKPSFNVSFNQDVAPFGPSVKLDNFRLGSNPLVPKSVENVYYDSDLKAVDAISYLTKKGYDEYTITKLMSTAILGTKKARKLVPTRWSITATDDNIGKDILNRINDYETIDDYKSYFGGLNGNYFLCILLPGIFRYELFEIMVDPKNKENPVYDTDYESGFGRKDYAQDTAGGYYAARLSVLRKLDEMKRKASVLVIRFITDEYWAPLGVWVVREATKNSMKATPLSFSSRKLITDYAIKFANIKFGIKIDGIISKSKLLKEIATQKTLSNFA